MRPALIAALGRRRVAPISPTTLFANAEKGVWYDPSDLSTLFQDSAGTTPVVTSGQPIGRMLDKSGNGVHQIQATASKRGVWGEAAKELTLDGVDDAYASLIPLNLASQEQTLWVVLRRAVDSAAANPVELSAIGTTTVGAWALRAPNVANVNNLYFASRGSSSGQSVNATASPPPNKVILRSESSTGSGFVRLSLNNGDPTLNTSIQGAVNYGNYTLFLGARNQTSFYFQGGICEVININRVATPAEVAGVYAYLIAKHGAP